MCVHKTRMVFVLSAVILFLSGCGEMNTVLPSTGTYQVKAVVNNVSLDDCSLVSSKDKIRPYFARSVSSDPDVTGLVVFLKNSKGEILGEKVHYCLENSLESGSKPAAEATPPKTETSSPKEQADSAQSGDLEDAEKDDSDTDEPPPNSVQSNNETLVPVKQFDKDLPYFPMPEHLPIGQYTLVFQVLGGKQNLYKAERAFYYLADAAFSFRDIQMHLPGITPGSRIIPKGTTIMLEARLDFDSRLDPYIVWYNGKKIISEGKFSDNAGTMLWKTPDQNGFLSLRAEAFPFNVRQGLTGVSREVSLPVSSKATGGNLVSGDTAELLHWYLFEGDLKDSKPPMLPEWALNPKEKKNPRWMPASGSYGLATGPNDIYMLPAVSLSQIKGGRGQFRTRFKPVGDGVIFNAQFGPSLDAGMNLSHENETLILKLNSLLMADSVTVGLPEDGAYVTAVIDFSIMPDRLEAKLDVKANPDFPESIPARADKENAALPVQASGELKVTLGAAAAVQSPSSTTDGKAAQEPLYTALWNEFALLYRSDANETGATE